MSEIDNKLAKLFTELDEEVQIIMDRESNNVPTDLEETSGATKCIASFNGRNRELQVILSDPEASHLILERS